METFWFFWLQFRRAYESAYNSDFWFLLGHKRSYDSAYDSDSDASENQPWDSIKPQTAHESLWHPKYADVSLGFTLVHAERRDVCTQTRNTYKRRFVNLRPLHQGTTMTYGNTN